MCSRSRSVWGVGRGASCHTPHPTPYTLFVVASWLVLLATGCTRDESSAAALSGDVALTRTSDLQAGGDAKLVRTRNPFAGDAAAAAEGERIYLSMNCAGCHGAKGGGAIGPPLRDADWIYGRDPAVLYQTIHQGRPNGMPAFGGKIPDEHIWKIVSYVEKLADEAKPQGGAPTEGERRRQPGGS